MAFFLSNRFFVKIIKKIFLCDLCVTIKVYTRDRIV